jgi:Zn-dependent peptidase ImmA (M78 family)
MSDWIVPARSKQEICDLANSWRSAFGFRDSLVPNLPRIIEIELKKLVPTYVFEVREDSVVTDDEGNRAYAFADLLKPSIVFAESQYRLLINDDPRARFTAAHELGHFLLHVGEKKLHRIPNATFLKHQLFRTAEWQANAFASEFLIPSFIAHEYQDPLVLADATKTSLQMAKNKLNALGLLRKSVVIPDLSFLDRFRT